MSTKKRPVLVVDWSDVGRGREYAMLKAAVPVGGRAVTIQARLEGDKLRDDHVNLSRAVPSFPSMM